MLWDEHYPKYNIHNYVWYRVLTQYILYFSICNSAWQYNDMVTECWVFIIMHVIQIWSHKMYLVPWSMHVACVEVVSKPCLCKQFVSRACVTLYAVSAWLCKPWLCKPTWYVSELMRLVGATVIKMAIKVDPGSHRCRVCVGSCCCWSWYWCWWCCSSWWCCWWRCCCWWWCCCW